MNFVLRKNSSERDSARGRQGRPGCAMAMGLAASLVLGLSACIDSGKIVPTSATASGSAPASSPNLAFDGDGTTVWNAGDYAPAWIQLDLGKPVTISSVRLNVAQDPAGATTHKISGGPTPDSLAPIGTLDGNTADDQWLELNQPANNVRYVRIETLKTPSWVAWKEIEIYK